MPVLQMDLETPTPLEVAAAPPRAAPRAPAGTPPGAAPPDGPPAPAFIDKASMCLVCEQSVCWCCSLSYLMILPLARPDPTCRSYHASFPSGAAIPAPRHVAPLCAAALVMSPGG